MGKRIYGAALSLSMALMLWMNAAFAADITACTNDQTTRCALETGRATNDPQFTPSNIADGVNILGVTGTYTSAIYPPAWSYPGPAGCPAIGDRCADNTIFAGWNPVTYDHLFIRPVDQGSIHSWAASLGVDDIATDSAYDGRANSNQVPNSSAFPAFKTCKDLSFGGHSDWYLPSQVEVYYLWSVRPQLVAKGNMTDFEGSYYWSSTEFGPWHAWSQAIGIQTHYPDKSNAYKVRCVRR